MKKWHLQGDNFFLLVVTANFILFIGVLIFVSFAQESPKKDVSHTGNPELDRVLSVRAMASHPAFDEREDLSYEGMAALKEERNIKRAETVEAEILKAKVERIQKIKASIEAQLIGPLPDYSSPHDTKEDEGRRPENSTGQSQSL